jgi:hypothetical protein
MRWVTSLATGLVLLALGVFFVVAGLDRADKMASVVGAFVGVGGLAVSVFGMIQGRRPPAEKTSGITVEIGNENRDIVIGHHINQTGVNPAGPSGTEPGGHE